MGSAGRSKTNVSSTIWCFLLCKEGNPLTSSLRYRLNPLLTSKARRYVFLAIEKCGWGHRLNMLAVYALDKGPAI